MHKNLRASVVKRFYVFSKYWFSLCLRASVVKRFYVFNKKIGFLCASVPLW